MLLGRRSRRKQFVTVEQVGGARACSCARDAAATDHRRDLFDRRRLDRAVTRALEPARSHCHEQAARCRSAGATSAADRTCRPASAKKRSISRCRAAARTAPSPGACSIICSTTGGSQVEGISGTSAGAMNAVMLADGLARGGPRGGAQAARRVLARGEPRRRSAGAAARGDRPAVLASCRCEDSPMQLLVQRAVALSLALRPQPAQHQSAQGPDRALRRFRGGARLHEICSSSSPRPMCIPGDCASFRATRSPPTS